jgi:hypothetical protein
MSEQYGREFLQSLKDQEVSRDVIFQVRDQRLLLNKLMCRDKFVERIRKGKKDQD